DGCARHRLVMRACGLAAKGYEVVPWVQGEPLLGHAQAVMRREDGVLAGGADPGGRGVTVWPGRGEPQLLGRTPARAHKREARMTQVTGETTLRAILAGAPDAATALIAPETERQWSYGALRAQVAALAARLAAMGIGRGDRVAIVLPNGP